MLNKISVLIVTFKGNDLLSNALNSINKIDPDNKLEIIVVDNSPDERTKSLVASFANARYFAHPAPTLHSSSCNSSHIMPWHGNPGFAGGNNFGWHFCTRPYVLLLNNDTIVHSADSFTTLVEFMETHPTCGAAQGTITISQIGNCLGGLGGYMTTFGFHSAIGLFTKREDEPGLAETAASRFSASGAYLMIRRSAVVAAGGFLFRSFFWCYYEEVDLCHRLWLAGYEVWYVPTEPVDHIMGQTSGKMKHGNVMTKYLENQYFSLLTCLDSKLRGVIIPRYNFILIAYGAYHFLRGNRSMSHAAISALTVPLKLRKRVLAARRQIQRIRKVSDKTLKPYIIRKPSLHEIFRKL